MNKNVLNHGTVVLDAARFQHELHHTNANERSSDVSKVADDTLKVSSSCSQIFAILICFDLFLTKFMATSMN